HQALVYKLVRRYADSPEDARDLAQRAFLQAFEAAARSLPRLGKSGVPFRAWLLRIAVNLGKNHSRARRTWKLVAVSDLELPAAPAASDELERAEEQK